jgi:hypothetical protein
VSAETKQKHIMKKDYLYTNQKDLRKAYKSEMIEILGEEEWRNMTNTTRRCGFNEWIDSLARGGYISEHLRCRATWRG